MLQVQLFLLFPRVHGGNTQMSDQERWWTAVFVIALFVGCFGYVIYKNLTNKGEKGDYETGTEWDRGIIPLNFLPTKANIYEIFIASACAIVVRDLDNYYMKFLYIDNYLKKNFRHEYYYAEESYAYSMRHVVRINSLADWANRNLQKAWKVKLVNFLAGIALYDGGINNDEQRYLLALMNKLNLEITDFETIYREKLIQENERSYQSPATSYDRDSFYRVLGLGKTASLEEVKAAYRRLVKLTHPDRFMNESQEVQKQMSEKFRAVQEAYESIVNS